MPPAESKPGSRSSRGAAVLIAAAAFLAVLGIAIAVWALVAGGDAPPTAEGGPGNVTVDAAADSEAVEPGDGAAPESPLELGPVPDPQLIAEGEHGPLPVTANDGRAPWQVYARPFTGADDRPRIAVIMADIGLNEGMSRAAIRALPAPVSMAVSPYAEDGQAWVSAARAAGHEVLLALPMEPESYPEDDPGPRALLTSLTAKENADRLNWFLSRMTGYVGVVNRMGSRFTATRTSLQPIINALNRRGLMLLDARTTPDSLAASLAAKAGMPRAVVNRTIDEIPSAAAIRMQLDQLTEVADAYGAAVGLAHPYPVTIKTLGNWAEELEDRGYALAPVTATANRQPVE